MSDDEPMWNLVLRPNHNPPPVSPAALAFMLAHGFDPAMPAFTAEVPDSLIQWEMLEYGADDWLTAGSLVGPFGIVSPEGMTTFRVVRVIGKESGRIYDIGDWPGPTIAP